jgi:hypothetical protein
MIASFAKAAIQNAAKAEAPVLKESKENLGVDALCKSATRSEAKKSDELPKPAADPFRKKSNEALASCMNAADTKHEAPTTPNPLKAAFP